MYPLFSGSTDPLSLSLWLIKLPMSVCPLKKACYKWSDDPHTKWMGSSYCVLALQEQRCPPHKMPSTPQSLIQRSLGSVRLEGWSHFRDVFCEYSGDSELWIQDTSLIRTLSNTSQKHSHFGVPLYYECQRVLIRGMASIKHALGFESEGGSGIHACTQTCRHTEG